MYVDTTIYGYVGDGVALHPQCLGDDDYLPEGDLDPDVWSGIFQWDDTDLHGLSCDGCGDFIFEPYYHSFAADTVPDRRDLCYDCGEYANDWLHGTLESDLYPHDVDCDRSTYGTNCCEQSVAVEED